MKSSIFLGLVGATVLVSGGIILSLKSDRIQPIGEFSDERILIQQGDLYGCIDTKGNLAIPCFCYNDEDDLLDLPITDLQLDLPKFIKTDAVFPFEDDNTSKIGYINGRGEEIVPAIYDDPISDELFGRFCRCNARS